LKVAVDNDLVWLAVRQLERFLLGRQTGKSRIGVRRKLLFKYAPAALALPAIMSITAPTPAQSASCAPPTQSRVAPARAMAIAHLLIATRELAVRLSNRLMPPSA